jgi:hypothetical protein
MTDQVEDTADFNHDHYEINLTPNLAADKSKTGISFKGSDETYIEAHKHIVGIIKKGDRYLINGVEISIMDAPENKPAVIEVKLMSGLSGKANIRIYNTGTIFISNRSGNKLSLQKSLHLK